MVIYSQGAEVSVRKYYAIGGQRVMREDDTNFYLLTDHLGSVVGIADGSGSLISGQRYMPYGLPRLEPGIDETDFGYTGQRNLDAVGLLDYNARWYEPDVARFVDSDPIVAPLYNSQALNHLSYVLNNPTRHTDPSGMWIDKEEDAIGWNVEDFRLGFNFPALPSLEDLTVNGKPPEHLEATIKNYKDARRDLFVLCGFACVDYGGKIKDEIFIALVITQELGSLNPKGALYTNGLDALYNQYHGELRHSPYMSCYGACTLAKQLIWATQMEGLYRSQGYTDVIRTESWKTRLEDARGVAQGFRDRSIDEVWFWGNVSDKDKECYIVVSAAKTNVYPDKPWFITYSAEDYSCPH